MLLLGCFWGIGKWLLGLVVVIFVTVVGQLGLKSVLQIISSWAVNIWPSKDSYGVDHEVLAILIRELALIIIQSRIYQMRKSEGVSWISENGHLGSWIHLVVRSSLLSARRKRDTKGIPFNTHRRILIDNPRVQTVFTTQVHHETSGYFVPHLIRMKCFKDCRLLCLKHVAFQ